MDHVAHKRFMCTFGKTYAEGVLSAHWAEVAVMQQSCDVAHQVPTAMF